MKKRHILILALLSTVLFAQDTKPKYRDRALFRYDNKVLFLSEVKTLIKQLDKFRCLKKDWHSLSLTKLTEKDYPRLPSLPFEKRRLNEDREFITRYISLQKLKSFAKDQLVKFDQKALRKINKSRCFPRGPESWSQEVKDLVKLELFLKSRYVDSSKSKEEQAKRLNSFLTTIVRKSENVLFF